MADPDLDAVLEKADLRMKLAKLLEPAGWLVSGLLIQDFLDPMQTDPKKKFPSKLTVTLSYSPTMELLHQLEPKTVTEKELKEVETEDEGFDVTKFRDLLRDDFADEIRGALISTMNGYESQGGSPLDYLRLLAGQVAERTELLHSDLGKAPHNMVEVEQGSVLQLLSAINIKLDQILGNQLLADAEKIFPLTTTGTNVTLGDGEG